MQDYFLSIGLCLFKGKDVGKPENGWMVTAAIVYSEHTWRFSGKTLPDVERWWKEQITMLDAEDRCLRLVLGWYKDLPTGDLEAIANWADSLVLAESPDLRIAGIPTPLSDLVARHHRMRQLYCLSSLGVPTTDESPLSMLGFMSMKNWRVKAARLYVRAHRSNGDIRRDLLSRRLARLARRACLERIRRLPLALGHATTRARL